MVARTAGKGRMAIPGLLTVLLLVGTACSAELPTRTTAEENSFASAGATAMPDAPGASASSAAPTASTASGSSARSGAIAKSAKSAKSVTSAAAAATAASGAKASLSAAVFEKLKARSETFDVPTTGSASTALNAVDQAFGAAMKQDDYINYAINSYRFSASSDGRKATVTVKVTYWENAAQSAYVAAQSKKILAAIVKPGMNAHQKVKAIHDWVLLHVAYDRTLVKHSAYDALKTGQTVCQGYASLTYRLLTDAGLKARIAEGTVKTGAHAWNLVQLDGKWYHLDTTFDDPVPDVKGRTEYGYYLVTDEQLRRDHRWTLTYPAATSSYMAALGGLKKSDPSRLSFYNNLYAALGYKYLLDENTVRTTKEIAEKIKQALHAGQSSVTVRYEGGATRKVDLQGLLDAVPALDSIQSETSAFPAGDPGDALLKLTFSTTG